MPKLTQIRRPQADAIVAAVKAALAPVLSEFGLALDMGRWKFSDRMVKMPMVVNLADTEALDTVHKAVFETHAPMFGIPKNAFNKTVMLYGGRRGGNEPFKIVEIAPNSPTYPIICERLTGKAAGKRYKFSAHEVKAALAAK